MQKITCFGEVLWDNFPSEKIIGGAPLNVAARMASYGFETAIISKCGNDNDGDLIIDFLNQRNVNTSYIQIDNAHPTGLVNVKLNEKGAATYTIEYPAAWDAIAPTPENIALVKQSDAFIFGSLASRHNTSRTTLQHLLSHAQYKVFDVNLRPPHYNTATLRALLDSADFIKFNDDEMYELAKAFGSKYNSLDQNIEFIANLTNTSQICVTKGRHGAVLFFNGNFYYNSGFNIKVVDTVGAGDSFLATLISGIVNGEDISETLRLACAVGALVAGQKGASQQIAPSVLKTFMAI